MGSGVLSGEGNAYLDLTIPLQTLPPMLTILAGLAALFSAIACLLALRKPAGSATSDSSATEELGRKVERLESLLREEFATNRKEMGDLSQAQRKELADLMAEFRKQVEEQGKAQSDALRTRFADLIKQLDDQGKKSLDSVKDVRSTVEKQLKDMREDNGKRLDEMRKTVDEKLQTTLEKRLGESFKQVSDRLEQVHKGLGEMQTLASGVGDLKKVLTNVKTKGILGEYQLANILEQMLPPDQYEENIATRPGSAERVEFAIRMPGTTDNESIWMPIDSKFPLKGYEDLLNAREAETWRPSRQQKALARTVRPLPRTSARSTSRCPAHHRIRHHVPSGGELIRGGASPPRRIRDAAAEIHITITGPTTMSALLNSLQMGFRTLAVTKRSSEVWKILGAVKTEFGKFSEQLDKVDDRLGKAKSELEKLLGAPGPTSWRASSERWAHSIQATAPRSLSCRRWPTPRRRFPQMPGSPTRTEPSVNPERRTRRGGRRRRSPRVRHILPGAAVGGLRAHGRHPIRRPIAPAETDSGSQGVDLVAERHHVVPLTLWREGVSVTFVPVPPDVVGPVVSNP